MLRAVTCSSFDCCSIITCLFCRQLCTGEKSNPQKNLWYRGCIFHRVIPNFMVSNYCQSLCIIHFVLDRLIDHITTTTQLLIPFLSFAFTFCVDMNMNITDSRRWHHSRQRHWRWEYIRCQIPRWELYLTTYRGRDSLNGEFRPQLQRFSGRWWWSADVDRMDWVSQERARIALHVVCSSLDRRVRFT